MANYKMITKELIEGYYIKAINNLDKKLKEQGLSPKEGTMALLKDIGDEFKQVLKDNYVTEECINEISRYMQEQGFAEILRSSLSKKYDK